MRRQQTLIAAHRLLSWLFNLRNSSVTDEKPTRRSYDLPVTFADGVARKPARKQATQAWIDTPHIYVILGRTRYFESGWSTIQYETPLV